MGIRFLCPNGHKLNVKSFQAGMKGICPYCGAKFVIPAETTPVANASTTEQQEAETEETLEIEQQPATVETSVGRTAEEKTAVGSQSPGDVFAPLPSERMQSGVKEKEDEQEPSKTPVIDQHSSRNCRLLAARQKQKRQIKIVVGLSVLAVALVCVLAWILIRGV